MIIKKMSKLQTEGEKNHQVRLELLFLYFKATPVNVNLIKLSVARQWSSY